MRRRARLPRLVVALTLLGALAAPTRVARAQHEEGGLFDRLHLDRFEIASLGVAAGPVHVSQVVPTMSFALTADYGAVAPHWRIVFGAGYWESRLRDDVVRGFVDTVRRAVADPARDDTARYDRIHVYDVTFYGGLRRSFAGNAFFRPYLSGGLAAHVMNADGALIQGTFVERVLDNISAGFFGEAGLAVRPDGRLGFDAALRGDLLNGFRTVALRFGASYSFGATHGERP